VFLYIAVPNGFDFFEDGATTPLSRKDRKRIVYNAPFREVLAEGRGKRTCLIWSLAAYFFVAEEALPTFQEEEGWVSLKYLREACEIFDRIQRDKLSPSSYKAQVGQNAPDADDKRLLEALAAGKTRHTENGLVQDDRNDGVSLFLPKGHMQC
jgi:hypothetical protein